jgi:hypothetical protein
MMSNIFAGANHFDTMSVAIRLLWSLAFGVDESDESASRVWTGSGFAVYYILETRFEQGKLLGDASGKYIMSFAVWSKPVKMGKSRRSMEVSNTGFPCADDIKDATRRNRTNERMVVATSPINERTLRRPRKTKGDSRREMRR